MKPLPSLIALFVVCGLLALAVGQAGAAAIGINIEVFRNGVSQGTALGGPSTNTNIPLVVWAFPGDTLRFVVLVNTASLAITIYQTSITADANNAAGGSAELRYVAGGAVELTGNGFDLFGANPNNSLNDNSPTVGSAVAGSLVGPGTASPNLYRIDYVVQAGVNADPLRDFTVVLGSLQNPGGDTVDTFHDSASVQVNPNAPEPGSLLLLGSGLAGLAISSRKKIRK